MSVAWDLLDPICLHGRDFNSIFEALVTEKARICYMTTPEQIRDGMMQTFYNT
jgi:hypothetical protein